jgi:hypothetical protein
MWIQFRPGGKFWCLQCVSYVSRKDVSPKIEDLGPEFVKRWEEHEKHRDADGGAASGASPSAAGPATPAEGRRTAA